MRENCVFWRIGRFMLDSLAGDPRRRLVVRHLEGGHEEGVPDLEGGGWGLLLAVEGQPPRLRRELGGGDALLHVVERALLVHEHRDALVDRLDAPGPRARA